MTRGGWTVYRDGVTFFLAFTFRLKNLLLYGGNALSEEMRMVIF